MTLPYTQIGAYEGGSSLAVYGDVDAKNTLHLFKTDLEVKDSSKASITFRKTSNDDVSMKLGVILKDGEQHKYGRTGNCRQHSKRWLDYQ